MHVVATPGHTADSVSFVLPADRAVLTGDTVLGRGTTVVAHPDGRLGAYLDSLHRLHALAEAREVTAVWPGHGPVLDDALAWLVCDLEELLHSVTQRGAADSQSLTQVVVWRPRKK